MEKIGRFVVIAEAVAGILVTVALLLRGYRHWRNRRVGR